MRPIGVKKLELIGELAFAHYLGYLEWAEVFIS
jgi:hypothetical protein